MKTRLFVGLLFVWLSVFAFPARAVVPRDTLTLTLAGAESQFLAANFSLLAQKFNVEAAKAGIVQAALFPNPVVTLEQQITNRQIPETEGKIFPMKNGEQDVQIQQLFLLAGKRNKQVAAARINAELSEYQFFDLLRTLSLDLRSSFFGLFYRQQSLRMYDEEIPTLRRLVASYQEQAEKGNVAYKEVIRLQSFLFELESGRATLLREIADQQATLKLLLGDATERYLRPQPDNRAQLDSLDPAPLSLGTLLPLALESRYDLKAAEANTRLGAANLSLQKALAVPDLALGLNYDKLAGYGTHYLGLTAQVTLPFFNRNQGNIRAAESGVEASKLLYNQAQTAVQNDLLWALTRAQTSDGLFKTFDKRFISNFDRLIAGVVENYRKRNISLLEFTDFLESYRNTVIQFNTLQADRMQAIEELNFAIGKKIFSY